ASCVVATQVLPRNGSLTRTTGPASRSRARVGSGSRMNPCEVRSMSRVSPAMPRTCLQENAELSPRNAFGNSFNDQADRTPVAECEQRFRSPRGFALAGQLVDRRLCQTATHDGHALVIGL